jgi:hypothetical protein
MRLSQRSNVVFQDDMPHRVCEAYHPAEGVVRTPLLVATVFVDLFDRDDLAPGIRYG